MFCEKRERDVYIMNYLIIYKIIVQKYFLTFYMFLSVILI